MTQHTVGTREDWLTARRELLEAEKQLTKRSDEIAQQRLALPWVPVETEYEFETEDGPKTLAELFDGRSQLLVYHFMLGPNTPNGCPGCTLATDTFDATVRHLSHHDVDFAFFTEADRRERRFNFGSPGGATVDVVDGDELMALSAFALEDAVVYHTYTCFDRGTDVLNGVWQLLDRAPRGREEGAEPGWPRRPDEYPTPAR